MGRRLVVALALAIAVSASFTLWLGRRISHGHKAVAVQTMYAAATRDMEAGDQIKAADLKLVAWPVTAQLTDASSKPSDLVGRTLLYPLAANQPILERQLSAVGAGSGLATRIPDGMRALSLKTDQIVGVAGFLLPGTHVDVLVTYHTTNNAEPITSTVLQDVRVLAAGQKLQPDPDGKPTTVDVVTLLVTPQDAEKAVLASTQGTVHFVLRNGGDHQQLTDAPTQMSALGAVAGPIAMAAPVVFHKKATEHVAAASKNYTVMVARGEKETPESFQ